jgi:hypothetical protein
MAPMSVTLDEFMAEVAALKESVPPGLRVVVKRAPGRPRKVHEPFKTTCVFEREAIKKLDKVCKEIGISRLEALREAVDRYVQTES